MSRLHERGFTEILAALGLVILMGGVSLSSSFFAGIENRRTVDRLDRQDSFNSDEVAAWSYANQTGSPVPFIFSNDYLQNLPLSLTAERVETYVQGAPRNVVTTSVYDLEQGTGVHTR